MSSTITEIEVTLDVDLDKAVMCDWRCICGQHNNCEKEAEWRMVRACCGFTELKCTEHKEKQLRTIMRHILVFCGVCGNRAVGYSSLERL